MLKQYILSVLLFFVFALQMSAQAHESRLPHLAGTVLLENGDAVSHATVYIKRVDKYALTDGKGYFAFHGIPFGEYTMDVSSIEIKPQSFRVRFDSRSRPAKLVVQPSLFSLEEVVVSANSQKRNIETRGFAVSVVEPDKIALQSIQTNELLDRTVGVRIRQDGGLGSRINYNINGLSGDAIKIFIDGVPAANFGSSFSLNSIPPSLIERIEVYKGVVPGNLSEDALGGAINIILKKKATNSLVASYSAGSFNTHQANVSGSARTAKGFTFEGSAFYNRSDNNYKVWGPSISFKDYMGRITPNQTARRFHDGYESYGAKLSAGVTKVPWADRFLVGAVLSKGYKETQHGSTMDAVYGDRHTRRNSAVFTLNYDKIDFLTKGLSFKIDASHSLLSRQVIDTVGVMYDWSGSPIRYPDGSYVRYNSGAEVGSAKTAAKNSEKTYVLRSNLGYNIAKGNTLYVNYMFNDFVRATSDPYLHPELQRLQNTRDLRKHILAATYENIAFGERLRTSVFYKHYFQRMMSNEPYRNEQTQGVPQYDVLKIENNVDFAGYGFTLSFALRKNLHLMASAEKAIRLPNANEVFGNVTENLLPPTTQLKPETSYNANVGVNAGPYYVGEHSFKLNTTLFLRDTRGMIREAVRTGSFDYTQFENLENVLSRGIDTELIYNYVDRLNFSFNISKFDVLFNTEFDQFGARYEYYRMQIRNEPSLKFNSNVSYYLDNLFLKKSKTSFYANINYVKAFRRNWSNVGGANLAIIPTQYPVDAGMSYTLPGKKIVLGLDAKNIFNQQVFDNFGLQKPGRSFFSKITYFIL